MRGINKSDDYKKVGKLLICLTAVLLLVSLVAMAGCAKPSDQKKPQQGITKVQPQHKMLKAVKVTARTEKSDEEAIKVGLRIPQISGMKDQKIQKSINEALAGPSLQLRAQTTRDAREYYQETRKTGDHFWKYEVAVDYAVTYNQNGILSLTIDNYQYTGGAHGGTERLPYNIDLNTGRFLALKDLFTPGFAYQSIINEEVRKQIAKQPEIYFEGEEGFKGIGENRTYYLIPGYVVVYFAQYEIAPYASGMPEFKIPVEKFGTSIDKRLIKG
ncbi:MAG: DUF3298 and DUF4163 domain-containing protein [Deltaproteobacteria bacterium]